MYFQFYYLYNLNEYFPEFFVMYLKGCVFTPVEWKVSERQRYTFTTCCNHLSHKRNWRCQASNEWGNLTRLGSPYGLFDNPQDPVSLCLRPTFFKFVLSQEMSISLTQTSPLEPCISTKYLFDLIFLFNLWSESNCYIPFF